MTGSRDSVAPDEVPERPVRATGVQLVGELPESGFADPQWLVQRDGRFVQVTELLYRVLERADGERTLADIAAELSDVTEWAVAPDDVRHLVRTRLIPAGLVDGTGGSARVPEPAFSPLALSMRMKVIGPEAIERVTSVLRLLYAPALLVPLLACIALAHAWLYLEHGVLLAVLVTLYTPGYLLAVLGLLLLSAVVHELGHAAALRYGGGRVRGMGVGMYLVFPAFYTDVTESYRLGRWARVRTDLGGFYFHLIFALGLMAAYWLTGQEFLLFAVVLINLELVRQTLPFVRMDGYWALADLTGIPDFFSQAGPFLRSLAPGRAPPGPKLPRLKTWVRGVFAAYLLLTIPVLGLLVFVVVKLAPTIALAVWDVLGQQAASFSNAVAAGDDVGAAAAAAQIVIVGLEILGFAYLGYVLAWRPARALWRWGRPTPSRRAAAAAIAAGAAAIVAWLWVPQLSALADEGPLGVEEFTVTDRQHVEGPVSYPQSPPVGGDHAVIWQTCGFYDSPVPAENAVHSLEHGAVWITYRPELETEQAEPLRGLARQSHVLVSPYPGLPAPIVASAWGRQIRLEAAEDPRLARFVETFRLSPDAPERGGPCTEGVGRPR